MRFAQLEGRKVAVWGAGREGRSSIAAIRTRLPGRPLTLFCREDEGRDLALLHGLTVRHETPDADALSAFDVVVKSPGISAYLPAVEAARERGTLFTSGTALWFGERPDAHVIGITGTKGKSTAAAMTAHLARAIGVRTALAGNIGLPLLELLHADPELWVVELSSFQTGEAGPLQVGVVTSLYEEHLDWHGTYERYIADKLKLAKASRALLVNATQSELMARTAGHAKRIGFGSPFGWHVKDGAIHRLEEKLFDLRRLTIPGAHNALNACAALAALEQAGLDVRSAVPALASFRPLPHRLQTLGKSDGITWINDSISTTPQAALAALHSLRWQRVTIILGGHDRGVEWDTFAAEMVNQPVRAIVVQGANRARIIAALAAAGYAGPVYEASDLDGAVARARATLPQGGVLLLSPGAPSFDQFRDYTERGRRFAALADFDADGIVSIQGLGVA